MSESAYPLLLKTYTKVNIQFVNICVDSQGVLFQILTKEPHSKSKFIHNNIKDWTGLIEECKSAFNMPRHFNYVETKANLTELLIRSFSFSKFIKNFKFWMVSSA